MNSVLLPLVMWVSLGTVARTEVGTGPQPSPTPIAWEFDFQFLDPERIELQLPGSDRPEVYWYMVYTVVNRTGRTQPFAPMFQVVTADLRVLDTDLGVSPLVFDAIAARHHVTHEYLVEPIKAWGPLLTGDDNARESVAIWRQVDLTLNDFAVYVAGLSGETRFVTNPAYNPQAPATVKVTGTDGREREVATNPKHFTLRKTLEIRYTLPGSPRTGFRAVPERGLTRWVMR
jgi:hypothetical protein